MSSNIVAKYPCPNSQCKHFGKNGDHIRPHCFYKTKSGRRRRYRCKSCGRTFSSTTGTPYYRLKKSRKIFDEVAAMSVEGVSKSSISRIKGLAWNTVAHWGELAARYAARFSDRMLKEFPLFELQADEICTFVGKKTDKKWLFTTLEVWSRLWISFILGGRSYLNVKNLLLDTIERARIQHQFLFTTDGFEPYSWAAKLLFGPVCIYGQVIKQRRNNRVTQVERRLLVGNRSQLDAALLNSEDSKTLNTSFVERHNLTVRRGSSYLNRKTICFARYSRYLEDQVSLLQTYYNFIRPHQALKFGQEIRTPAMQAGLVNRKLSFRDIFTFRIGSLLFLLFWLKLRYGFVKLLGPQFQIATVN